MKVKLEETNPSLVLLDLHLPDSHGLELAKELRRDPDVGIIILTGSEDDVDKIVGLELGADDYLNKPVDNRELLARIRTVLRRVNRAQESPHLGSNKIATFANLNLDFTAQELRDQDGHEIKLTSHEYQLLATLVQNTNRVMSRDQLMDGISGREWVPSDRSIDVLISKIRNKLKVDASNASLIKSVRGAGYKFTARVTIRDA